MAGTNLLRTLKCFHESGCRFILVGGLAAVLNGAPIQTYDIDLVYAINPENIEILLSVLESMDAIFRIQPERLLRPRSSHLAAGGHLNLLTSAGPLDLLGTIGDGRSYEDLIDHSVERVIDVGIKVRVLNLETLIAMKEALAGEKDLAVLPVLRRTLDESRKKET